MFASRYILALIAAALYLRQIEYTCRIRKSLEASFRLLARNGSLLATNTGLLAPIKKPRKSEGFRTIKVYVISS